MNGPVAGRVDEVEAAVNSVIDDVATVETTLVLQVLLVLVVDVLDDILETNNNKPQHMRV